MSERDRQKTEKQIIDAVARLLGRKGFGALGINAIAREAGIDKVLIYRYFGGLPQLLEAFAKTPEYWSSFEEIGGGEVEAQAKQPLGARLAGIVNGLGRAFRKRPLSLEAMAWETVESNPLTQILAQTREQSGARLLKMLNVRRGSTADTTFALLSAGVLYLSILSRHEEEFGGIPLKGDSGWKRIENAVQNIMKKVEDEDETE